MKSNILNVLAASVIMAASSQSFAGFTIASTVPDINATNTTVQCDDNALLPAILDTNLPYSTVKAVFLGGENHGLCVFKNSETGAEIGAGRIIISGDLQTASAEVERVSDGYSVGISGSGTENLTVVLGESS